MPVETLSLARPLFDWRLRSRSLRLGERTLLMAIVNLTPDSFSGDGMQVHGLAAASTRFALAAAIDAVDSGADIIDLGAESTRPDSVALTSEAEQARLLPVLEGLRAQRPEAIVSVDTYHAATAKAAAKLGAEIVNDVSGLMWDEAMAEVVAQSGCGLVLMHTRGRPQQWREQPPIPSDQVLATVFAGLIERLALAEASGIATERIIADPGFGFGKRGTENLALLAGLGRLHELDRPLLIGLSRKGFLGEAVRPVQDREQDPAEARRVATIAAHTAAVLAGAHVLRVHEVQPAREAAAIADALLAAGQ
jgi:dihydropteroate synthase